MYTWFLWGIAVQKHIVEDLLSVFENNQIMVNDILTLSMFPLISKWNYNQTARWQTYTRTPSNHYLSSTFITRLTQKINDNHRMNFFKLRIQRQPLKAVVACDSTTRSAYGKCLADIRWGKNKDNEALQNTLEVVVYSIDTHEPIYYRTFAGNENDARTLRTIIEDLKHLGCRDLLIIFDRGYESEDNIIDMISNNQSFLVCGKTAQTPVYNQIERVSYNSEGLPTNMDYDQKEKLYVAQFPYAYPYVKDGQEFNAEIKVNLFLNMTRRIEELIKINESIKEEYNEISKIINEHRLNKEMEEIKKFNKAIKYHKVGLDPISLKWIIEVKELNVMKAKNIAGFHASIAYKIEGSATEHGGLYELRDEQEKYFEEMKDQLGFNLQMNSSEDGKIGKLFILFIGLILRSAIRSTWKEKLSKTYNSSVDILHEMNPIRLVKYDDGSEHVTAFTTSQMLISNAFNLPIPTGCLSCNQQVQDTMQVTRKRGRPIGSINKSK